MDRQEHIDTEEREIDLRELFFVLFHKKGIILLVTFVFVLGAVLVTKLFITPIYVSSAKVYVISRQNQDSVATNQDLSAATQLTNDAKVVITSREVMEQVIEKLNLDMTAEALAGIVSVSNDNNTRILTIRVSHSDSYMARDIADAVVDISASNVEEKMGVEKMSIVDSANIPEYPSKPSLKKNAVIAGAAGLVFSCMVILAVYLFNDKIRNAEDVERYLGLTNIGIIPVSDEIGTEKNKGKKEKRKKR